MKLFSFVKLLCLFFPFSLYGQSSELLFLGYAGFSGNVDGPVVELAAGDGFTVALQENGKVVAWGYNLEGESTVPEGLPPIKAIAVGHTHALALTNQGKLVAWGDNSYSQTGIPANLGNIKAIAAGRSHNLVLKDDGTVEAWGYDTNGQLIVPPGLKDVRSIAARSDLSVALTNDNQVICWGYQAESLVTPPTTKKIMKVVTGGAHLVALLEDSTIMTWGDCSSGQCNTPQDLGKVVDIAAGNAHTAVVLADGTVRAWGDNSAYQTSVPAGLTNVASVCAGSAHTVVLKKDGTVAWGNYSVPKDFDHLRTISASHNYVLGLREDSTVVVWGEVSGVLASPWAVDSLPPNLKGIVAISAGTNNAVAINKAGDALGWGFGGFDLTKPVLGKKLKDISAGYLFTLGLTESDSLVGWGSNNYGQLSFSDVGNVKQIKASSFYSMVLKKDGTMQSWGYDASNILATTPTMDHVKWFSCGDNIYTIKEDDVAWVWIPSESPRYYEEKMKMILSNWDFILSWSIEDTLRLVEHNYNVHYVGYHPNVKQISAFGDQTMVVLLGKTPPLVTSEHESPLPEQMGLHLYPNPCRHALHIQSDLPLEGASVEISSLLGQTFSPLLEKSQSGSFSVPVESLSKGIYLLKVMTPSKTLVKTFLIE